MKRICILASMTLVGLVGWWIGARIGLMTGFTLSSVGSVVGVYLGWRINRHYLG
jgi:predicted membrane chloride channel (bestrophin family)